MMHARELRIGNIINIPMKVISPLAKIGWFIGLENIEALDFNDYERGSYLLNDCSPEPLTEEWLLKFGFKIVYKYSESKDQNGNFYYKWSNGVIWFDKREHSLPRFSLYFDNKTARDKYLQTQMLYVHQFQNLYFALTGSELEIK